MEHVKNETLANEKKKKTERIENICRPVARVTTVIISSSGCMASGNKCI